MLRWLRQIKQSNGWVKLSHWEYWPFQAIYFPIYPVWLWFALKCRSLFFFGYSNPGITNAGFLMESKQDIFDNFPGLLMPATFRVKPGDSPNEVWENLKKNKISFPVILKPDIGMQGLAVYKVMHEKDLLRMLPQLSIPFIIQPFVSYPNEIGIFYVKMPGQEKGSVTGVVKKEFVTVTGDGKHTIRELLMTSDRFRLQIPALEKLSGEMLNVILPEGENKLLVPFGNHARGSLFLDVTNTYGPAIESVIQHTMKKVPDFHYGRLDIRYNSIEELQANKNWTIIELNGAGSEPTHMYDPEHSLFFAWKEIIRHWNFLYKISKENKKKGSRGMSLKQGIQMYKDHKKYQKLLREHTFLQP
jgi:hypothetical protein